MKEPPRKEYPTTGIRVMRGRPRGRTRSVDRCICRQGSRASKKAIPHALFRYRCSQRQARTSVEAAFAGWLLRKPVNKSRPSCLVTGGRESKRYPTPTRMTGLFCPKAGTHNGIKQTNNMHLVLTFIGCLKMLKKFGGYNWSTCSARLTTVLPSW